MIESDNRNGWGEDILLYNIHGTFHKEGYVEDYGNNSGFDNLQKIVRYGKKYQDNEVFSTMFLK